MTTPRVSVLVPVRDADAYVESAITDLLAQSGVELEVLVVDDGSTDRTARIVAGLAGEDSRVRRIPGEGSGPAQALNAALGAARFPWISHMEADDRCPANRLAVLCAELAEHPDWDGVLSQAEQTGAVTPGMQRYLSWQNSLVDPVSMERARFVEIPGLHQSGLYRYEFLRRIGGYVEPEQWPLDIDFWMRAYQAGARIGKVAHVLYSWRQHPAQATRTSSRHRLAALQRCKAHYFARGPARGRSVELFSRPRTGSVWEEALREAGAEVNAAISWRPGDALPARRSGAVRLFVFGMPQMREQVRRRVADFDPGQDWFAG